MAGRRLRRRVFGAVWGDNVAELPTRLPGSHRLRLAHHRRAKTPGRADLQRLRRGERHQLSLRLRRREYIIIIIIIAVIWKFIMRLSAPMTK